MVVLLEEHGISYESRKIEHSKLLGPIADSTPDQVAKIIVPRTSVKAILSEFINKHITYDGWSGSTAVNGIGYSTDALGEINRCL